MFIPVILLIILALILWNEIAVNSALRKHIENSTPNDEDTDGFEEVFERSVNEDSTIVD